jgi:hypothetical protein
MLKSPCKHYVSRLQKVKGLRNKKAPPFDGAAVGYGAVYRSRARNAVSCRYGRRAEAAGRAFLVWFQKWKQNRNRQLRQPCYRSGNVQWKEKPRPKTGPLWGMGRGRVRPCGCNLVDISPATASFRMMWDAPPRARARVLVRTCVVARRLTPHEDTYGKYGNWLGNKCRGNGLSPSVVGATLGANLLSLEPTGHE